MMLNVMLDVLTTKMLIYSGKISEPNTAINDNKTALRLGKGY